MNKTQLVEAVAAETNLSKKDAEAAVKATFAAIEGALVKGDKVQLIGFGTFETRVRGERTGKNPRTGETVKIAACKIPAFKARISLTSNFILNFTAHTECKAPCVFFMSNNGIF